MTTPPAIQDRALTSAPPLLEFAYALASLADPFVAPVLSLFNVPAPSALAQRVILRVLGNPQSPAYTRGFEVINLSSRPKIFQEYTTDDEPALGPDPGRAEAARINPVEVTYYYFSQSRRRYEMEQWSRRRDH